MTKHQPQHVAQLRSQRQSNSNLVCSLRHCIRRDPVNSNRRKQQRHQTKNAEHSRLNLRRKQCKLHVLSQRLHVIQRHVCIDRQHLAANRSNQSLRISFSANSQNAARLVILGHRRPDKRTRLFGDVEILAGDRYTHNATKWSIRTSKTETLADSLSSRLQLRHQTSHEGLINNRHSFGLLLVLIGEFTSLQDRSTQGFEVGRPNARVHRKWRVVASLRRFAFNKYRATVVVETEWDVTRDRRRFDSRQRLHTFQKLMVELLAPRFVVSLQSEIERHGQRVLWIETRVHRLQLLQSANHESG